MAMHTEAIGEPPSMALAMDEKSLLRYLKKDHPDFFHTTRDLKILQLTYGQSNPTYIVQGDRVSCVLRKRPPGKLLASAHDVRREYTILKALEGTRIPVPCTLGFCSDESVVGTSFYLMEHVAGTVYSDANLPMLAPIERQEIYSDIAATLGALHDIRPSSVGLQNYGRSKDYCRRQVNRWWRQFQASVDGVPESSVVNLKDWLLSRIPQCDADPGEGCIAHGDFKVDNFIFSKSRPRKIKAVLDWELSTLGNPWADVAYCCLPYYMPSVPFLPALSNPHPQGVPSESKFLELYCKARRNISPPTPTDWAFYKCLSLFRLASIVQGVGARAKQGNASSKVASSLGSAEVVNTIVGRGLLIAQQNDPMPKNMPQFDNAGSSGFEPSGRVRTIAQKLRNFMNEKIFPAEPDWEEHCKSDNRWDIPPLLEELKSDAKKCGLWNLWLPADTAESIKELVNELHGPEQGKLLLGPGLSNLEYAHLSEIMGACFWASEVFNCSAPDTGNMELLARFGSREQKIKWLLPLLEGKIRSCFGMTERMVASSDARNIQSAIVQSGEEYILNGRKWWTSGALHPFCEVCIFMGKTDFSAPTYKQQSMVLVPMKSPGIRVIRPMLVYGYDDAPEGHAEIVFENVRVPRSNVMWGEGRGFEMAQARLGPGRLHHCMRLVGLAERSMTLMKDRAHNRTAFGGPLASNPAVRIKLAECRVDIEAARLLVLNAANDLDKFGNKAARVQISAAKIFVPRAVCRVIDYAVQLHGGSGVSDDTPLARMWVIARTIRIADGPDEVHLATVGRLELEGGSKL
ncbi:hypothetical protein BSKO_10374 [Bryopsis sp. KO-2023]|nr:hypothetical protein BSKO_10374 [Bryopsis sp. KO-2023]